MHEDAREAALKGFFDVDLAKTHTHLADKDGYFPSWNAVRVMRPREVQEYVDVFEAKFGVRPDMT